MVKDLWSVAVRKKIVGFEVFVDFDELEIAAWIFTCAAGT